ncbi:MAG: hypothetical protein DMG52_05085 [Acidobacteria bacterium]|nr:MAG: hypothetical protein DMG52_05085 [Acidobacteriota bacterium]
MQFPDRVLPSQGAPPLICGQTHSNLREICTTIMAAKEAKRETAEDFASRANNEPQRSLYFSVRGHPLYHGLETACGRAGVPVPSLLVRAHDAFILRSAGSNKRFLGGQ